MGILKLNKVTYKYEGASEDVLKNVSADFEAGNVYAIVGKSGSGKSTLLSLMAGLDIATEGEIKYNGGDLRIIDRDSFRSKEIGVIFQGFNLLTNANPIENITLSMNIGGNKEKDKKRMAIDLLKNVNIDEQAAKRKVLKLSGGQQQRVAIARALANKPNIILADEPTGNLDGETEDEILDIFTNLAINHGKCVIIITHSEKVAAMADVVYQIENGFLKPSCI